MQLKIIKADGTIEEYLHTKVIAALTNAMFSASYENSFAVEQLADTVTFYLYRKYHRPTISSSQILSIIKAILTSAGYEEAAVIFSETHYRRNLLRSRIEVTEMSIEKLSDAERLKDIRQNGQTNRWNKSRIIRYLITNDSIDSATARTIASMVEEQVINSHLRCISTNFIKYLVLTTAEAVLTAADNLQADTDYEEFDNIKGIEADMEVRFRQRQKGFCPAEV